MKDKVIGIVITDGVGYRNFVLSPFFNELTVKYNVIVIYSGLPKNVYSENLKTFKNIIIRELKVFSESKTTWFYRKLKEVAHMYLHRDFLWNYRYIRTRISKRKYQTRFNCKSDICNR